MLREKVTKLAKIMFTGLTMALCVTALNPAVTAKAEDMLQESEQMTIRLLQISFH